MIEIITFRLRSDVDVAAFRSADERVQTDVAYQCDGLLRRTLARDGERWLVLQIWAGRDQADDGAHALEASEPGQSFLDFIDPVTVVVDRFDGPD